MGGGSLSLIKQLFRKLVKQSILGEFWRSLVRHYKEDVKLDDGKMLYIVSAKERGERPSDLAMHLGISRRRVEQVYAHYRKHGLVPSLKKPGRHRVEISYDERSAVKDAVKKFGVGACYLVGVLKRFYGIEMHHMKVYRIMREEGMLSSKARRYFRRKWIRYERAYSNSLWHTDWYQIEDPAYKDKWLVVYEDDASRFIVGYGVFDSESSENAVKVLDEAIRKHGRPRSILTDRGSPFYAVEAEAREKGLTKFELYLMRHHIRHILGRVSHPQTNGKVEKLFHTLEKGLAKGFIPIEECIYWYNCMKPHGALDLGRAETPIEAYYRRTEIKEDLMDPSLLTRGCEMIS